MNFYSVKSCLYKPKEVNSPGVISSSVFFLISLALPRFISVSISVLSLFVAFFLSHVYPMFSSFVRSFLLFFFIHFSISSSALIWQLVSREKVGGECWVLIEATRITINTHSHTAVTEAVNTSICCRAQGHRTAPVGNSVWSIPEGPFVLSIYLSIKSNRPFRGLWEEFKGKIIKKRQRERFSLWMDTIIETRFNRITKFKKRQWSFINTSLEKSLNKYWTL